MPDDLLAQARAYGTSAYRSDTATLLRRLAERVEDLQGYIAGTPPTPGAGGEIEERFDG